MAKILIIPDNIEFEIVDHKTILDAGLANNLNLPHACKNGTCGACKCKVISGGFSLDPYNHTVLTDEEIDQGYTLLCKAHAKDDMVLDIPDLKNATPIKIFPAKVISLEKTSNIAILKLKVPQFQKFVFNAGQYIEIMLHGKNRSYSIANACKQDGVVEIHVRYHATGVFSEYVWHGLESGKSLLRFRGPLGNFKLQPTENPIIFVCTGTGFAPIKAIIESLLESKSRRTIYLYWGNRNVSDFYYLDNIKTWEQELNLKVVLCLSSEQCVGYRIGYVTAQIDNDFKDLSLSEYEVYACGNLQMIEGVYKLATDKFNLLKQRFFSDAFTPSV
jgi:CDP-4-dehydro-6-deoxyglucose reductase